MYADDTALLSSSSSPSNVEVNAYIGLSLAAEYCANHDLVFNASKTKQISFGCRRNFVCNLPEIDSVESVKHLGIIIDEHLDWNEHTDTLCQRLSTAIFALRRTVAVSTEEAALTAYYALFESVLCYGIVVWGGSSVQNLHRVLLLQKRAIRTMTGLKAQESCRPEFKRLRILTVVNIFIFHCVTMVDSSNVSRHQELHSYNTRRRNDYNLPAHNTSRYAEKPSYMRAKFFNALPDHLKSLEPKRLKKELKCWLCPRPFYSIAEFLSWQQVERL